ncbi:MAG: beta-galactosidase, partial [Sciscionella sp.]|nr:beta-galactosidase [Sciscionella sp.]
MTVDADGFARDGKPHRIFSGALHYFRVLPQLWPDRLARLRAMGLNTVETYVAWNFHERRQGEYDFAGRRDVVEFIQLAGRAGLDVIVRPGPYICAEWDFGGLPAWLLSDVAGDHPGGDDAIEAGEQPRLRCADPRFLAHVDRWFD